MRTWQAFSKDDTKKSRFWECIAYPENMQKDWKRDIEDIVQLPFAYCVHDKDSLLDTGDRKVHIHIIIAWAGPTTRANALNTVNKLSEDGKICCPAVSACVSIRRCYEYLIHNTDNCKTEGKYLYDVSERVEGNNFDIGAYETISTADKIQYLDLMEDLIYDENILDYYNLNREIRKRFGSQFRQLFLTYSGHFYRILQEKKRIDKEERVKRERATKEDQERELREKWKEFCEWSIAHDRTPFEGEKE